MNEVFVEMQDDGSAEVVFSIPIQGLFTYWIDLVRPYLSGQVRNEISRFLNDGIERVEA